MPDHSRSQIDKLGKRLRKSEPSDADLLMLGQLRSDHAVPLDQVVTVLRDQFGIAATGRFKTNPTIIDKLRRPPHTSLSRMQDIAGARVVGRWTLTTQRQLADEIAARFEGRVHDRCEDPRFGYRAMHVIVEVDRCFVEIQLRTEFQHQWAEIVEKVADSWGRGIRYGLPPSDAAGVVAGDFTRQHLVDLVMSFSKSIAALEGVIDGQAVADPLVGRTEEEYQAILTAKERERNPPLTMMGEKAGLGGDRRRYEEQMRTALSELRDLLNFLV